MKEQQARQPWATSTFADCSTQSLCVIKIVADTSMKLGTLDLDDSDEKAQDTVINSIPASSSFGFTIGAKGLLMPCISDIRRLASRVKPGIITDSIRDSANDILRRLDECRAVALSESRAELVAPPTESSRHSTMAFYHLMAFICATYIYLHRTIFNVTPEGIKETVAEVFHYVQAYFALNDGNFTLWPVFIASVEAYQEEDLAAAMSWLENASKVGMGNRVKIQAVIKEVWRTRQNIAISSGQDLGSTIVDWRDVMTKLDADIVLV